MKKGLKVTLIVVAVIILVVVVVLIDITRVIEKQDEELLKITNTNNALNIFAYSVDKTKDKLVITMYGREDIIKYIQTYYTKDGIITSTSVENHYSTKLNALLNDVDWDSKKINKNVEEFLLDITNAYKNFVLVK